MAPYLSSPAYLVNEINDSPCFSFVSQNIVLPRYLFVDQIVNGTNFLNRLARFYVAHVLRLGNANVSFKYYLVHQRPHLHFQVSP